uniref:Methyltransferase FkbM domain-containing protein n=1 Tax=Anopheles atroparvus TaxID=41427 RepID=A0A182IV91_ANOAO
MTIFSSYGVRAKVQEKKEKMSPDEQQQQQNQIPNIAGTILIGGIGTTSPDAAGQQKHSQAQHNNQHHQQQYSAHLLPHLHQFCTMTGSNPASLTGAQKLPSKSSPLGPSPFRQLLPVTLCIISFATVLSILIIYMDTTEIRHQQFRLNMSRDYDLMGVPQDNPALIKYVRDIHMKKYPMTFIRNANAPVEKLNFTNRHELTPEMAHLISDLLGRKRFGTFFQSLTGNSDAMMTAPWLAETMNWGGYLVEPDPRKYFSLRKQNAFRSNVQVIHACLSPNTYPKEVTLHHDDDSEVQINSVLDEETEWFHPRVKCFPVYTLMLAVNRTSIDLLSLGCHGQELQILQTIPFDRVHIKVISIHLVHYYEEDEMMIDVDEYVQSIGRFLMSRSYKLLDSSMGVRKGQESAANGGSSGGVKAQNALVGVPSTTTTTVATTTMTVKLLHSSTTQSPTNKLASGAESFDGIESEFGISSVISSDSLAVSSDEADQDDEQELILTQSHGSEGEDASVRAARSPPPSVTSLK